MISIYLSMLDTEQERKKVRELYEEHKYALLHYAIKIIKNQDMAEDAVHNAFISIIEKKEKYLKLNCRDFRRLAVIIVRNKCIDMLRKQKPFANIPIEELEIFLETEEMAVDEQAIQILRDIALIKEGTEDEELAEEFFQYFARINGIDIDSVTEKNGALIRNSI